MSAFLLAAAVFPTQNHPTTLEILADGKDESHVKIHSIEKTVDVSWCILCFANQLLQSSKAPTVRLARSAISASAFRAVLSRADSQHHGDSPPVSAACQSTPVVWI